MEKESKFKFNAKEASKTIDKVLDLKPPMVAKILSMPFDQKGYDKLYRKYNKMYRIWDFADSYCSPIAGFSSLVIFVLIFLAIPAMLANHYAFLFLFCIPIVALVFDLFLFIAGQICDMLTDRIDFSKYKYDPSSWAYDYLNNLGLNIFNSIEPYNRNDLYWEPKSMVELAHAYNLDNKLMDLAQKYHNMTVLATGVKKVQSLGEVNSKNANRLNERLLDEATAFNSELFEMVKPYVDQTILKMIEYNQADQLPKSIRNNLADEYALNILKETK